ncbi:MAG TPA: ABC transporter permease [candidate division Zixibacteria bacterium]|nr:ABC transporter permease [candidate division Zixibacteria bacterium]
MMWRYFMSVFRREVDIIRHDRNIIIVLFLAPVVYALFLGTILIQKVETDIPIVVVDNDHSEISRTLIRYLDSNRLLKVSEVSSDFEAARANILKNEVQAIIYIPDDFGSVLKSGQAVDLAVYLNTARFLPSNDINKGVNEVALTMGAGIRLKYFQAQGINTEEATELVQPLRDDTRSLFNISESYGEFLLPGLLLLILQQTLLFGLALSIAREREQNTMKTLVDLAGGNSLTAILGKGAPYFILYASYTLFSLGVFFVLFHLSLLGSLSALAVLLILFLISIIAFTFCISSFLKKEIQALQFLVFTSMPLFLISGYSWPIWSMPRPLQVFTQLLPSTQPFLVFVRITQMGAGWGQVLPDLLFILVLTVGWMALAQWRVKCLSK